MPFHRWLPVAVIATALLLSACGGSASGTPPTATATVTPATERLFYLDNAALYEITGNTRRPIIQATNGDFFFDDAVSPDGNDVALAIQPQPKQTESGYDFGIDLFVSRGGATPQPIVTHQRIGETVSRPVWLPDGHTLLYAVLGRGDTGAPDIRIERMDLNTGVRERFIDNALEPALSHDGATLAYVRYDQTTGAEVISLRDMATGATRDLLPPDQIMTNVANLAWSPNGSRLAFAAADPVAALVPSGGGRFATAATHPTLRDVWLANLDGTGLHRITELADSSLSLAWASDNTYLYTIGDTGFWHLNADTGALDQIGDPNPAGRVQTLIP